MKNNELEEQVASPELQLFFEKLIALKNDVKSKLDRSTNVDTAIIYNDIFEKLDAIIKVGE